MSWRYMTNPQPYPLPLGGLYRYESGPTALVQIMSLHKGAKGYHGKHCMGGTHFVLHDGIVPASDSDYKKWVECEKWRSHEGGRCDES